MVTIVIERDNCSASFGDDIVILAPDKKTLHDILERLGAFRESFGTADLLGSRDAEPEGDC